MSKWNYLLPNFANLTRNALCIPFNLVADSVTKKMN